MRMLLVGGWLVGVSLAGCASTTTEAPPAPAVAAAPAPAPASSAGDPYFRAAVPRGYQTIFTPLELPEPNERRLASGAPGPEYWQQQVDYQIDTTLDEDRQRVSGRALVTYTNNSPHELTYLWLHLEQNLFKVGSVGSRMVPPRSRFANREDFEGGFDIEYVRLAPPVPSSEGDRPGAQPAAAGQDLPLAVYDTVGRVDLPVRIPPRGGKFRFEIAWSFKVPKYGADRMGVFDAVQGKVYQLAQWFPAVAVYDDVHGWHTDPYLGQGEFHTNFGDFDVRITVPRSHIVVATGLLQNESEVLTAAQVQRLSEARGSAETVVIRAEAEVEDAASRPAGEGPLTWHFQAEDVRTFAWSSSASFIWDAAFLENSGPLREDGTRAGTLVQSVYPGEGLLVWPRSTEYLRFSIDHYNRTWFTYPYPSAVNVNGIVGGMEYPMIIYCGARREPDSLFGVTAHEIGHNWFPMIVSNDERRHAWLDEGFNTFVNYYCWEDWRPGSTRGRRGDARTFVDAMLLPNQQAMETPADQVMPGRLGTLQYAKTATGLVMLREFVLGPERFDAAFREYMRRWAFKHPEPADFFRTMEDVSGAELSWFWRGWFLETGTLDQAVEDVVYSESGKPQAAFINRGELVMPVEFKAVYEDGTEETRRLPVEVWYYTNRWVAEWDSGGRKVKSLTLDPGECLPDINVSNNTWTAPEPTQAATPAK